MTERWNCIAYPERPACDDCFANAQCAEQKRINLSSARPRIADNFADIRAHVLRLVREREGVAPQPGTSACTCSIFGDGSITGHRITNPDCPVHGNPTEVSR